MRGLIEKEKKYRMSTLSWEMIQKWFSGGVQHSFSEAGEDSSTAE